MKKTLLVLLIVFATVVSAVAELKNVFFSNFTSGVLTRKLDARIDYEKFANGLRTLENMSVYVYGGAFKRPGTYYVTGVSNHSQKVRLIPFVYSTEQAYIIEAGDGYMRFYMDEGQIQTADSYTKLLLHGDGSDASTAISDFTAVHTMNANGNAQIDTAQNKFGTGSIIFDGDGDYVSSSDHVDWYMSNEMVTWEQWVRFNSVEGQSTLFMQDSASAKGDHIALVQDHALGQLILSYNSTITSGTSSMFAYGSWTPTVNQWYHVALIRGWSGTTGSYALTVDGSAVTTWASGTTVHNLNGWMKIGSSGTTMDYDLGQSGATTTFNAHAKIKNTASKWGSGSLYLDGTGDYVSLYSNNNWKALNNTNVTIDFWVKHDDHAGNETYVASYYDATNYWQFRHEHGNGIAFLSVEDPAGTQVAISGVSQITDTNWHHVAFVKVGTSYGIYLDGVQGGYVSDADTMDVLSPLHIGAMNGSDEFAGYIADLRISHTNRFSAAPNIGNTNTITVPTARTLNTYDKLNLTFDHKDMNGWVDELRYSLQYARWESTFSPNNVAYPNNPAGGGAIYQITSPYNESELDELKYVQSADYLYIAHSGHSPYQLTRSAHNSWALAPIVYSASTPFGGTTGYPSTVEFHEERLVWAGSTTYPQRLWMSKSGDYNNYTFGSSDSDAMDIQIAASDVNAIRWLNSGKVLAMGTTGGEWTIGAMDSSEPITPTNIQAKRQTNFGTENIMAHRIGKDVVHVQYGGKKLRAFSYKWEEDSYHSRDLLLLAEHLTENTKIRQMAYQKEPNSTLWCILDDGNLLGLTYLKEQNIYAWHKHTTTGRFESIAVIPGPNDTDQVWFSIIRTINGTTYRFLEFLEEIYDADVSQSFYLDAGLSYSGATVTSISGLTHLAGVSVAVMENGYYSGLTTVSSGGTIGLTRSASKIHAGLTYTATLETIDIPEGFTKWRKISTIRPRFFRTVQADFGPSTSKLDPINFDTETTPFTGTLKLPFPGAWSKDQTIVFQSDEPYPFTLSGVLVEFLQEN